MNASKIEWTEATWSPVIGCTKVSAGCKHCYAEREVETRWSKNPKSIWYGRRFTDVLCRPEAISGAGSPLRWKKPRRIFVCPRADLFHPDVPAQFIADVFGVMAATPQHTFQVLTKRPERMLNMLGAGCMGAFDDAVEECMAMYTDAPLTWPLPNVWIGVSIEDQATADERIPLLLQTPAAVRWVSAEPLLGRISLRGYLDDTCGICGGRRRGARGGDCGGCSGTGRRLCPALDWAVVGGESGPHARPMHPDWARSLRDQCSAAGVPFLFKQWGEWLSAEDGDRCVTLLGDNLPNLEPSGRNGLGTVRIKRVGKHRAGRLLDGVLHDGYPEARS